MSKIVNNFPVCQGCIHSSLHYCNKYNEKCISLNFKTVRYQIACCSCLENDGYTEGQKVEKIENNNALKAYFHVPGPEYLHIYESIMALYKYYPEMFYENHFISEIYGAFGGAIWNGRTPDYGHRVMTIQEIDDVRRAAETMGISINLTWNNHLVSGTDVYDRFCNAITEVFHNGKHAITVASPELFNYLKEKYPNYKYYQSVISTSNDAHFNKKDERFDMFLMNRNLNNNWDELLKVPMEERDKIEFLCNDICSPFCNRMVHYNIVNACLLNRSDESCLGSYCTVDHDFSEYNCNTWPITVKPEDINKYLENGFQHFKLCSRGDGDTFIAYKVLKYLIKPEYFTDAYFWVLQGSLLNETDILASRKIIKRSDLIDNDSN